MTLKCVKFADWSELRDVIRGQDNDFWVSCETGIFELEMPQRLATMRVQDLSVPEVFTHCFIARCQDVKAAANALTDEFGLGLRRKRVKSAGVPGCVFALVSDAKPSLLALRQVEVATTDREERVPLTNLQFHVVGYSELMGAAAKASKCKSFWLTAFQNVNAEDCKKRVLGLPSVEGASVGARFASCLLFEAANCHVVTERLTDLHGLGQRTQRVRSRQGPGCLALLVGFQVHGVVKGPSLTKVSQSHVSVKRSLGEGSIDSSVSRRPMSSEGLAEHPSKQRRLDAAMVCTSGGSSGVSTLCKALPTQATPQTWHPELATPKTLTAPLDEAAREELHFRQAKVLESRLAGLLPTLLRDKLSTEFVQAKLEQLMKKPTGRLDAFKLDIARIWRTYLENHHQRCVDNSGN